MSPLDLRDAVSYIRTHWQSHWQRSQKDWADTESLFSEFEPFTAGALKQALHGWWKEGVGRPPTPDQLIARVRQVQHLRIERGVDKVERGCTGDHVWADPWPTDEDRERVCVLCGEVGSRVSHEHAYAPGGNCWYCPKTNVVNVESEVV